MRLSGFDLNLLVALDALLHEKNVTRAAERIFVTQPAMSLALRRLRDYFNDPLLVRVGNDHELTARGLALLEPVREMLLRAQRVLGTQAVFDAASMQRTFKLMLPEYVAMWLLPGVLRRLVDWAPGIRIRLENWTCAGPAQVVTGEVDLLVAFDDPEVLALEKYPDSLCRAALQVQPWICALASDHPEVGAALTREQFLSLPHVTLRVPGVVDTISLLRKKANIYVDARVATDSVLQIPFLLPGTRLISVLPECIGRRLAACTDLKLLEIPDGIVPQSHVELLWHRRNEPDPAHAWLRGLLIEAAGSP